MPARTPLDEPLNLGKVLMNPQREQTRNLRIGIPSKGRLSDLAGELLARQGCSFAARSAACLPASADCRST